jgi:hypothetical protein
MCDRNIQDDREGLILCQERVVQGVVIGGEERGILKENANRRGSIRSQPGGRVELHGGYRRGGGHNEYSGDMGRASLTIVMNVVRVTSNEYLSRTP